MEPASGYEWGWDAWVAIGTGGLALATLVLAVSTWRTAKAAAADVRAQWRPAIAPGADAELDYIADQELVVGAIRNVGKGPALQVEVGLDLDDGVVPASLWTPGQTDARNLAILPPGESMELYFEGVGERPGDCEMLVDSEDINGRVYSTRIRVLSFPVPAAPVGDQWVLVMTSAKIGDSDGVIPWRSPPGRLRGMLWRFQYNRGHRKNRRRLG